MSDDKELFDMAHEAMAASDNVRISREDDGNLRVSFPIPQELIEAKAMRMPPIPVNKSDDPNVIEAVDGLRLVMEAYDLADVIANELPHLLSLFSAALAEHRKEMGTLLLSGLLTDKALFPTDDGEEGVEPATI